jgi:hypothetical protein
LILIGVFGILDVGQTVVTAIFGGFTTHSNGKPIPEDVFVLAGVNMLNNVWIYLNYFYYGCVKKGLDQKANE